ncbi:hypothetical protein R1flu_026601 [Riccia fluitans]|uniref:Uncharacterized protein n=1 Tax=Riccia fluitans TaxID=41844 RepID=A0ABD1XH52_9MARC
MKGAGQDVRNSSYGELDLDSQVGPEIARKISNLQTWISGESSAVIQRLQSSYKGIVENWKSQGQDIKLQPLEINSAILADGGGNIGTPVQPFVQAGRAFHEFLKHEINKGWKPTCVISAIACKCTLDLIWIACYSMDSKFRILLKLGYQILKVTTSYEDLYRFR